MLPFDEAMDINNTPTKKGTFYQYYFPKESEAVVFEGVKYAVSYWWTSLEMPTVIKNANDFLKYTVEEIKNS